MGWSTRPRRSGYAAHDRVLLHLSPTLQAIVGAWRGDPQFRTLVGLVFFTLLSGTIFYFSVTTLTTVGLGDLSPTTTLGKLFTAIYIFAGLSLALGFIDTVAKETFRSHMGAQDSGEDREEAPGS